MLCTILQLIFGFGIFRIQSQARIQDSEGGGVRTFRRGGGFVQEFQERIQIVAGPGQINKQKKIADSRRGGGGGCDHPKETPVSAPESHRLVGRYVAHCILNHILVGR